MKNTITNRDMTHRNHRAGDPVEASREESMTVISVSNRGMTRILGDPSSSVPYWETIPVIASVLLFLKLEISIPVRSDMNTEVRVSGFSW